MKVTLAHATYTERIGSDDYYVKINQERSKGKTLRTIYLGTSVQPGGSVGAFVVHSADRMKEVLAFVEAASTDFDRAHGAADKIVDGEDKYQKDLKKEDSSEETRTK